MILRCDAWTSVEVMLFTSVYLFFLLYSLILFILLFKLYANVITHFLLFVFGLIVTLVQVSPRSMIRTLVTKRPSLPPMGFALIGCDAGLGFRFRFIMMLSTLIFAFLGHDVSL